jgi:hypothetical protein
LITLNPKINQIIKNPYIMFGLGFGLCYLIFFQPFILIGAVVIAVMVYLAFRDKEKLPALQKNISKEVKGWLGEKQTKRMTEPETQEEEETAFGKPVQCLECGSRSFKHKLGCSRRRIGIHVEEAHSSEADAANPT